jgi:zinc/manganese transport system substrate-binding protein
MQRLWRVAPLLATLALLLPSAAAAAVKVFACEPEWAALAREIGSNRVSVFSATTALQDVHRIQARPSLIAQARTADLVVCSGAELEIGWLPLVLQQAANPKVLPGRPGNLEAARYLRLLDVPAQLDRSMGDVHPQGNPHVHWDPRNIEVIAAELQRRLAGIDPAGAADYSAALDDFRRRWSDAMRRWEQTATPLRGVAVIEHHKALTYLFAWLQIPVVASLEPKPGVEPTSRYLRGLVERQKTTPARMVVRTTVNNPRPAEWLSGQLGIPVVEMPYSVGGTPGAKDLFGMFDDGIARLLAGAHP